MAPNKPATAVRTVRIDPVLWDAALEIAAERGTNVSAVIRECLKRYVRRHRLEGREQQ